MRLAVWLAANVGLIGMAATLFSSEGVPAVLGLPLGSMILVFTAWRAERASHENRLIGLGMRIAEQEGDEDALRDVMLSLLNAVDMDTQGATGVEPALARGASGLSATNLSGMMPQKGDAAVVLDEIGFPKARVPVFDTAEQFWHGILRQLEQGVIENGRVRLFEVLARRYPGHELFKAGAARGVGRRSPGSTARPR